MYFWIAKNNVLFCVLQDTEDELEAEQEKLEAEKEKALKEAAEILKAANPEEPSEPQEPSENTELFYDWKKNISEMLIMKCSLM